MIAFKVLQNHAKLTQKLDLMKKLRSQRDEDIDACIACYMHVMRVRRRKYMAITIISQRLQYSQWFTPMDTLLHPIKRSYSKHFKRIFQSNTKGFNEAEASDPRLVILFS